MKRREITEIYYCDRCGEKMIERPAFYCRTHPDTTIQILRSEWVYADLCDKCKESFKAWWYFANQIKPERSEKSCNS